MMITLSNIIFLYISVEPCGSVMINPITTICCNGLVYIRQADHNPACCGNVAYDSKYHMCCANKYVQQKTGETPECCGTRGYDFVKSACVNGEIQHRPIAGTTCCNTDGGTKCCRIGDGCCLNSGSGSIDIPGFKPVCCDITSISAKALCCSTTTQKTGVQPYCCSGERVRPICCLSSERSFICCRATVGIPSCCSGQPRYSTRVPWPVYQTTSMSRGLVPVHPTVPPSWSCCDSLSPQRWCCITYVEPEEPDTGVPSCCHSSQPHTWCCSTYIESTPQPTPTPAPTLYPTPKPGKSCCRTSYCCTRRRVCCHLQRINCCSIRSMVQYQSCCNSPGPRPSCCRSTDSSQPPTALTIPHTKEHPSCCVASVYAISICCRIPSSVIPLCCNGNSQLVSNTNDQTGRGQDYANTHSRNTADYSTGTAVHSRGTADYSTDTADHSRGTSYHSRGTSYHTRGSADNSRGTADNSRGTTDHSRGHTNGYSSSGQRGAVRPSYGYRTTDQDVGISHNSDSVPLSCCESSYREDCCYSGLQLGVTPDCCDSNDLLRSEGFQRVQELSARTASLPASIRVKREAVCSGRVYDIRRFVCCQGVRRPRRGIRPACCGNLSFDLDRFNCCGGYVRRRRCDNNQYRINRIYKHHKKYII